MPVSYTHLDVYKRQLEECVEQMHSVIQAEHLRCSRNTNFIEKIQKELKEMKGE